MALFGMGDDTQGSVGNALQAIGAGLLSGDRYNPIGPGFTASLQANAKSGLPRSALKQILMQAGYSDADAEKLSATEGTAKLALDQKKEEAFGNFAKNAFAPVSNLGGPMPSMSPAAPPGPASGASLNGGGQIPGSLSLDDSNVDVAVRTALAEAGNQGPEGLKAVAGTLRNRALLAGTSVAAEALKPNQYEPWNAGSGNDPRRFKVDSPEYQAAKAAILPILRGEAPDPTGGATHFYAPKAQAALGRPAPKWDDGSGTDIGDHRFFRLPYAGRDPSSLMNAGSALPIRTADASGAIPQTMPPGASGLNPGQKVDVANNENDTQVLEGRMGMYPPNVYGVAKPATQTADAANIPSPDAIPAEFRIPLGSGGQGQPAYAPDSVTAKAIAARRANAADEDRAKVQRGLAIIAQSGQFGDRGKAVAEAIKLQIQPLLKNMEETDAQKLVKAADLPEDQARSVLAGAIPGNAPTNLQKDYASYRTQEIGEGRVPLSQLDFDLKLRREAKADINIRNDAEKKEEVGRAESVTKFLGGIADSAPATAKRAATLDQLGRLISRTSTAQGTTLRAQLDGIGKELGLSSGELKTKTDAINAIVNSLAPQMREPGSGTVSDADLRGFLAALPNLSATPEGNQLILAGLKRATDVDRERTKIAAQWQAGKISASDARAKIAEIDERSIYASEAERSLVSGLSPIPDNKAKPGWRVLGVE